MTRMHNLCRGVQGYVQRYVHGKPPVSIGLCRGVQGFTRTRVRVKNNLIYYQLHCVHSRAHGQHPCTPLHTLHTPYSMRVSDVRTPAHTPAHPCTHIIYP